MELPEQVGERIQAVRREHGWTQDDLARRIGVSRSAIAQWETGRSGQLSANLSRVAGVLGVGVEFLLHGDEKLAPRQASGADEWALLRLYRECTPADRQMLLRMVRRLANASGASRSKDQAQEPSRKADAR